MITAAPINLTEAAILSPEEKTGFIPVAQNTDWVTIERPIGSMPMVLVPAGCFMMGSSDGDADEQPMTAQCFDRPFWIDKYEVTNRLFWTLDGAAKVPPSSRNGDQPRDNITFAEAQTFCNLRGARLPTEREWEYAARGPSNLIYPWGNDWNDSNIVWIGSHPAEVGSRFTGISWVGALDMAGNISEWVSSLYRPYPYQLQDGREGIGAPGEQVSRIHRGQGVTFMGDGDFRSANRIEADVPYSTDIGFRCVRSI
jgi:iron(II)-dependent oxidoreductase